MSGRIRNDIWQFSWYSHVLTIKLFKFKDFSFIITIMCHLSLITSLTNIRPSDKLILCFQNDHYRVHLFVSANNVINPHKKQRLSN